MELSPRVEVGLVLTERQTLRIVQVVDRARNTFPEPDRPPGDTFKYALAAHGDACLVRVELHDLDSELPVLTEIVVDHLGRIAGEDLLLRCEAAAQLAVAA